MQMTYEVEEEKEPRRNMIQERIEKHKSETNDKEREEEEQKAKVKQKQAERSEKLKKTVDTIGNVINTGANVVQAIPHFAALAIGAGAGGLLQKWLGDKAKDYLNGKDK